jgi:hypothetical protein
LNTKLTYLWYFDPPEGDSITIETTEIDQSENIETVTVTTDEQANKDVLPVNIFQNVSSKLIVEPVTMTTDKQTFFASV